MIILFRIDTLIVRYDDLQKIHANRPDSLAFSLIVVISITASQLPIYAIDPRFLKEKGSVTSVNDFSGCFASLLRALRSQIACWLAT